jgi:GPH family glycoside/pentoside/hexuronide:cation symporter
LHGSPFWLRAAGLFPEPGDPAQVPSLFAIYIFNTACSVGTAILGASMMADIAEHSEAETGRRNEGVFYAGAFFILAAAGFPENAQPGQVAAETIDRLATLFPLLYLTLACSAAIAFLRFPFGADEHRVRVAGLAGDGEVDRSRP